MITDLVNKGICQYVVVAGQLSESQSLLFWGRIWCRILARTSHSAEQLNRLIDLVVLFYWEDSTGLRERRELQLSGRAYVSRCYHEWTLFWCDLLRMED